VIGGLIGFAASLLGSLLGVLAAPFVGVACGRRSAERGTEGRASRGALAGLVGGAVATPVFLIGSAAGALVTWQTVGGEEFSRVLDETVGVSVTASEAWTLYLLSLVFAAVLQAFLLILASVVAGALRGRRTPVS
jgi:hypothetical protein